MKLQPHLKLTSLPKVKKAIVCGSPERAKLIAEKFDRFTVLALNREYHSYLGETKKEKILITSHGVGSSGAMICFQELANIGIKTILRLGTAGGLYDEVKVGDLVVATSAVRQDGVSSLMVPVEFPATADLDFTVHLSNVLTTKKKKFKRGTVVSSDLFYPGLLDGKLELFAKAGAIAVEMELSALFIFGALRKVQTAGMVVCDGNPLKWSEGHYDPNGTAMKKAVDAAIELAIEAISTF